MGISRDSRHKRRLTGGRVNIHQKKRKSELGRPAAMTKLVADKNAVGVHTVRGRGGNKKFRALRLESGNFALASEGVANKVRILDVVYNSSNNELVRTKTLVKNAIVQVDAAPFRNYLEKKYNIFLGKKGSEKKEETKRSGHVVAKAAALEKSLNLDAGLKTTFESGRLYACISSRPGQCGRADGYILEGKELDFYLKKLTKKK